MFVISIKKDITINNMKKLTLIILFFFLSFLIGVKGSLASSCTRIGNSTFCDDGTSYQQIGNSTFGSDGTSYQRIGNATFGSDGTSYQQIGNATFGSDGTSYQQIGNSTFGSDGSSYQTIGNTTYGSGNTYSACPTNSSTNSSGKCSCDYGYSINSSKTGCTYTGTTYTPPATPTCPPNSYYDGLSLCKCNYGYVLSGSVCIRQQVTDSNSSNYSPSSGSCPTNSHTSLSDSTKCKCDSGYQINSTNDSCILVQVKTNREKCQNTYGINVDWLGGRTPDGLPDCVCKSGYIWNSANTACILNLNSATKSDYNPVKVTNIATDTAPIKAQSENNWWDVFWSWFK